MLPRRILWPTDFIDTDLDALKVAADMARAGEGEMLLLHVADDPAEEVYGEKTREGKDRAAWALWRIVKDEVEGRLRALAEQSLDGGGNFRVLCAFGDPAVRIAETVRDEKIDLVVLAARRERSRLSDLFLGNVAYKVVRTVPCSVLVVK